MSMENSGNTKVKCIKIEQNNQSFYIASLSSELLKKMCFITRRTEVEGGFQRLLNEGRANSIKKYLDDEKGVIPTPLILSAQKKIDVRFESNSNTITFNILEKGFLIIDGQHRLFGLLKSDKNYEVPVVIFDDLTSYKEVNLFIDINTTQKGVPAALLIDLKEMSGKETDTESKQRELFDIMNSTAPMAGYLSPSTSTKGKVSRKAFNESTEHIFGSSYFNNQDVDMIAMSINNYLLAVEKAFILSNNEEARLNKTVIFNSIMNIFLPVVQRCLSEKNNLRVDSYFSIIESISTIAYESFKGSNKQTISNLTKELNKEIEKKIAITEEMF